MSYYKRVPVEIENNGYVYVGSVDDDNKSNKKKSAITLHYQKVQTHSNMAPLLRHFTRLKQYFAKPSRHGSLGDTEAQTHCNSLILLKPLSSTTDV